MTKPNILVLMVDQLNGTFFPDGPADWLHTPALRALAAKSRRYNRAYTASPLCAPGRAGFMSGRLPSGTRVYDNAAEFSSDLPTYAHHLRRAGYSTCLSGKMHFVGPDQLHGFEQRMTTDVYPADFGWTPDYRRPGERIDWWYHNMGSVTGAGVAETTNQLEYDDEVAHFAVQKLYDLSRGHDDRPWHLTVSFTHPHDPYVARQQFWDLYGDCEHLEPDVAELSNSEHDPHSQRILASCEREKFDISKEDVRRSRRAYFANISYIDSQIEKILSVLKSTEQEDDTIVIFTSDHGDMLGEKGLWFKMSFFEGSAKVPLMISGPGVAPGAIDEPVSTLDITPTLAALAGIDTSEVAPWCDGVDLNADGPRGPVPIEYAAEASIAPMVALVDGPWKATLCSADPAQLFNLNDDPHELSNLAEAPEHADRLNAMHAEMKNRWDLTEFDRSVRDSQARRLVVYDALRNGAYYPWDFQPLQRASERYMRNHMDLNVIEEAQRFPRGN